MFLSAHNPLAFGLLDYAKQKYFKGNDLIEN